MKFKIIGFIALFSLLMSVVVTHQFHEVQAASINFAATANYEMYAKFYLLKNEPSSVFGMPGPALTRTQIAKQKLSFKKEAAAYFKAHPDTAQFLRNMSSFTDNVSMYRIAQKMDLIQLTKTSDGYTYHFQGGSGCSVEEYTGTLTMNESFITDDVMEMHEHPTAC